ncbi:hypothetical protein Clacol_000039 [Clathrus columnatus]|uniref:Uncharacterized protein n=1 Tax=Clathrus columnatus TaxID=1419009 RepID=A0AAV4ZW87_9AGAM|nr:hypothetical protein Clacol_000039 [Clathrus columnatus]
MSGLSSNVNGFVNNIVYKYSSISLNIVVFIRDIVPIVSDALAFIGIVYQVLGIWKSKKRLGLQSNHKQDLVTSLLQQGVLRFSLSTIIICEFTLALRRRNMEKSTANMSGIRLPTLSLPSQNDPTQTQQSVLERLRESLIAEMAERPDPADSPNSGKLDVDGLQDNDDSDNPQDNMDSVATM